MALPLTRSTTYSPGTTPAVKSADLNDLQDYLAGVYVGSFSVKSLTVDGTGGVGESPTAGRITASENVEAAADAKSRHLVGIGTGPNIATNANLGTGRSASVAGKDTVMLITFASGTGSNAAAGLLVTVTFGTSYGSLTPRVQLTPANANARGLSAWPTFVDGASFGITAASGGTWGDSTTYIFNAMVAAY